MEFLNKYEVVFGHLKGFTNLTPWKTTFCTGIEAVNGTVRARE